MRHLSIALFFIVGVYAQTLSLDDAVKQTIQTNPTILERLKNFNAVREDLSGAYGKYMPSLSLRAGIGQEKVQSNFTNDVQVTSQVQSHSLTLNYNLFNGFGDLHTISQQDARLQSAAYSYLENVDDVILKLIESYVNVLRHNELMTVEKDNIKMDEKIYDDMLGKQKQGLQRLSDLKEARSKLALAYTNHLSEENNIQDTLIKFHKVFGRYINIHDVIEPKFHEQLPSSIEAITKLALANNPSIKVALFEMHAASHDYKSSRKSYMPSIDVEVSGSYSENLSGIQSTNTNLGAMVYLNYNLFNGFSDSAKKQKKVSIMQQKSAEMAKIKRDVIQAVQLAWTAFRITSKQSVFIKWYVNSSKDKLNSYYKEFNIGRRSLIDLLGASDDYNNARRKMIHTKYDLIFARYRLLDAMGELTEALGVNVRSRVGLARLKDSTLTSKDVSQLNDDIDTDRIANKSDICDNSVNDSNHTSISHYGCQERIRSNNSDFKALDSFLKEKIEDFVPNKSKPKIEGWDE